ncbi:amino acid ABC transporter substrate-binding protein [Bosea sp. (in: a-proteobacteria)]|uniref:amino acid ABC transporter substrate-binding protein n=1 Tax=Bosea sp. (in: a-proteobacteria) TaxID=1871050 RepID=UPI001AC45B3C|nr:amino acid ABC transporter substrate-binding protein [Bosea sp. (in: a-proteobacteria)]MBN9439771.1 amino acid ABC transporter substrate-binding protein [Bosea sp. (in: a-proteobacteria)]
MKQPSVKRLKQAGLAAIGLAAIGLSTPAAAQSGTLDRVKARGELICGNHIALPGFGLQGPDGRWDGLDIDLCRAVSSAIFNDPNKIKFIPTTPQMRFLVVQSGEVDMLARNATYTMSRDTSAGMSWPIINYFDGQGFMVRKSLGVSEAKGLSGASICVTQGTTTELNLADFFRANNLKYEIIGFATNEEGVKALEAGRCDAFTTDSSGLAAERLKFAKPDDFMILPTLISREPLGPAVKRGDESWFNLVKWTHYAMLNAEELGVTKANVDEMLKSTNPEIKRLLGVEGKFGEGLGLTNDWAYRIIKHVGNYGESFERNVGMGSKLQLKRGLNDLASKGGLQYPHPIR